MKIISWIFIALFAYAVIVVIYSLIWMGPHSTRAKVEFERKVIIGSSLEGAKQIASELKADKFSILELRPPEDGISKRALVYFDTFPGGFSKHICFLDLSDNIVRKIKCSHFS